MVEIPMQLNPNPVTLRLYGQKFYQFDHAGVMFRVEVEDLPKILCVKPRVQRKLDNTRVKELAQYIIRAVRRENVPYLDRSLSGFLPTLVASTREQIDLKPIPWGDPEEHGFVMFSLRLASTPTVHNLRLGDDDDHDSWGRFSLGDGQHRLFALLEAAKTEPLVATQQITIQLFPGLSPEQEEQLFVDINLKQRQAPKNVSNSLDYRDYTAIAARTIANKSLLRVDQHGPRIGKSQLQNEKDPKWLTLTTLRGSVAIALGDNTIANNADLVRAEAELSAFFTDVVAHFKSLLSNPDLLTSSAYFYRTCGRLFKECKAVDMNLRKRGQLMEQLAKLDWSRAGLMSSKVFYTDSAGKQRMLRGKVVEDAMWEHMRPDFEAFATDSRSPLDAKMLRMSMVGRR